MDPPLANQDEEAQQVPVLSEEARKLQKAAEIERKKAEIRARVAEARKQQDLEIARKQAEKAQSQAAAAAAAVDAAQPAKPAAATAAGGAVPATAAGGGGGGGGGELRIDVGYAHFKVLPQDDERGNPNFPYNLHNACELFCRTGNVRSAIKVKFCVDTYRELLAAGPDGRTGVSVGRATVCWICGHTGLPRRMKDNSVVTHMGATSKNPSKEALLDPSTAGLKCGGCGESGQINFVLTHSGAVQVGGSGGGGAAGRKPGGAVGVEVLPWIEAVVKGTPP